MKILEHTKLRQPSQGLIVEANLGANITEDRFNQKFGGDLGAYIGSFIDEAAIKIFIGGDCTHFIENKDLQRNGIFDPFDCVTCAHQGAIDTYEKAMVGGNILAKQSRRYTAVDSGTVPGQGNSNNNVQLSIKRGMVPEAVYTSLTPTMQQSEFFREIPADVKTHESFRVLYDPYFIPLPTIDGVTSSRSIIKAAMEYGVVVTSVNGYYQFDGQNRILRSGNNDTHDIFLGKLDDTKGDLNMDSENPEGLELFSPTYNYHYCTLVYLKKKVQTFYKTAAQGTKLVTPSALMSLGADGLYYPFESGDTFKAYVGPYASIKIVPRMIYDNMVATWPNGKVKVFGFK